MTHTTGTAQLRHATWVHPDTWFYECPECPCDFGPLTTRSEAAQQARQHDREYHDNAADGSLDALMDAES